MHASCLTRNLPTIGPCFHRTPNRSGGSARALFLLVLGLVFPSASGADIFMLINGVPGGSTAPGHSGWIDVLTLSHGLFRTTSANANYEDVSFLKRLDSASPFLIERVNTGAVIPEVQIEFTRNAPAYVQFYKLTLTGVRLNSVSTSGLTGPNDLYEDVTFSHEQIAWSYTQVETAGLPNYSATWNLTNNTGTYSTNLLDADFDGMPNDYELANGLNPNLDDANDDLDHDGLTNYQEFLAGTNPNNPNSVFRVTRVNLASGQVRITWSSVAGKTYTISAASQVNGAYTPVRNVPSAGDGVTFTDFPPSTAYQFYRVSTP